MTDIVLFGKKIITKVPARWLTFKSLQQNGDLGAGIPSIH